MDLLLASYLLLALCSGACALSRGEDLLGLLPYSAEEVDRVIVQEFLRQEVSGRPLEALLGEYAQFRKEWVRNMIEFLIKELEINEEGAEEARKNPEAFYINYDTYKLLMASSI